MLTRMSLNQDEDDGIIFSIIVPMRIVLNYYCNIPIQLPTTGGTKIQLLGILLVANLHPDHREKNSDIAKILIFMDMGL